MRRATRRSPTAKARRPRIQWGPERLTEQEQRLAHARQHCDLYLDTSSLTLEEVREEALSLLRAWKDRQGGGNINHSAHLSGAIYGVLFMLAMDQRIGAVFLSRLLNPGAG